MAGRSGPVLGHLYQLLAHRGGDGQTDGQLLRRFVAQQEEQAFTILVQRHGPLVLRVCRRLLGNSADAEDAFQATFLVLVRKAHRLDQRGSLAGWLYGVAYRVSVRTRARAAQRRAHERQAGQMHGRRRHPDPTDPALRELLDQELSRLPEKYRSPVVLCYLEGKSHVEAARQLQWPVGTVRSRMARGRTLLRRRLTRRGLAVPMGLFGMVWAPEAVAAAVPAALMRTTVRASLLATAGEGTAAGAFSASVTGVAHAVMREMTVGKLRNVIAAVLALATVGAGTGILVHQAGEWAAPARAVPHAQVSQPQGLDPNVAPRLVARLRHGRDVRSVALAPDGSTLVSGGTDGILKFWDLTTSPPAERAQAKQPGAAFAAFSADGKVVVSGSVEDGKAHLWDPATGRRLGPPLAGTENSIRRVAFSPRGDLLAAGGYSPAIQLWDFGKQQQRDRLHLPEETRGVNCLAFSPDGTKLASAGVGGPDRQIHLWDIATGQEVRLFSGHQQWVNALTFFPDSERLASGSADQTVRLWDVATGREIRRWNAHANGVAGLALSHDGRTLISGGGDRLLHLWDTATGRDLHRLEGHPGAVTVLALSWDEATLASGSQEGTILIWKLCLKH